MNNSLTSSVNFIDNHFDLNSSTIDLNKSTISLASSTDSFTKLIFNNSNPDLSTSNSSSELTNSNSSDELFSNSENLNEVIDDTRGLLANSEEVNLSFIEILKEKIKKFYSFSSALVTSTSSNGFNYLKDIYYTIKINTRNLKNNLKEKYGFTNENTISIKNYSFRDSFYLFCKLFTNRTKGKPNIYIFYKSKNI